MRTILMATLLSLSTAAIAGVSLHQGQEEAEIYRNVEEGRYFERQNSVQDPATLVQQAQGYVAAFYRMKETNPKAKIYFMVNGISKSDIVDVEVLEGGTLLLITQQFGSKTKQEIIHVEDIEQLGEW